jgi:hypothetical protein
VTAIVFTSVGSRKYHFDQSCKAFESAQLLSDADCGCDTYCTHRMPRMHALKRMSATHAAMGRKLPCLACVPEHLREMPEAEDFGHKPVIGFVDGRALNRVCARCRQWDIYGYSREASVRWPCTSAIVLGLVERDGATP